MSSSVSSGVHNVYGPRIRIRNTLAPKYNDGGETHQQLKESPIVPSDIHGTRTTGLHI